MLYSHIAIWHVSIKVMTFASKYIAIITFIYYIHIWDRHYTNIKQLRLVCDNKHFQVQTLAILYGKGNVFLLKFSKSVRNIAM